jgi:mevalonate kinase
LFKSKMESKEFSNKIKTTLNPAVHNAINAMLIADKDELRKAFFEISYFQLVWMPEFIPLSWIRTWEQKLSESSGYYKLCGAGGGGFLLECKL